MMDGDYVRSMVSTAIAEDIFSVDVTSAAVLRNSIMVSFCIVAREDLILCGMDFVREILYDAGCYDSCLCHKKDGDRVVAEGIIVSGVADSYSIAVVERVLLNFLQHGSGIASATFSVVELVKGFDVVIRGTRKTLPGLRAFENYAIRVGGGETYRKCLDDAILVKDNHLAALDGDILKAVSLIRSSYGDGVFIAIECEELREVEVAVSANVNLIILDNMHVSMIKDALGCGNGVVRFEASGGVSVDNVRDIAETGVDYISMGWLTHSARAKDISMECSLL